MPTSQDRAPLGESLAFHGHRPASSLVARQYTSTLTSSAAFPAGKDAAVVDATNGAVNVTLPAGNDAIIGLPFHAERATADASSNAVALACAGTDTFADGGTSISSTASTDDGLHLAAVWDGSHWRPYFPGAANGGGAGAFTSVTTATLTATSSATLGDGTGSPVLEIKKTELGTSAVQLTSNAKKRWTIGLDASENLTISRFNTSEVLQESSQFLAASGMFVAPTGITITTGGLLVSAGGATVTAGGLTITAGGLSLVAGNAVLTAGVRFVGNAPSAADDAAAAALSPTVPIGGWYHTSGALKQRLA